MNENAIFVSFEILTTKGASEKQIHRVFHFMYALARVFLFMENAQTLQFQCR